MVTSFINIGIRFLELVEPLAKSVWPRFNDQSKPTDALALPVAFRLDDALYDVEPEKPLLL